MLINDILSGRQVGQIAGGNEVNVKSLPPETTVHEATRVLRDNNIGTVVVCEEDGRLVGILSERDVVFGLADHGNDILAMEIRHLMTNDVETCTPSDQPHVVMQRMTSGGFRHMPVVEDGVLKGVISSRDILDHYSDNADPDAYTELFAGLV